MKAELLTNNVEFPEGVTGTLDGFDVTVKGPKGEITREFKNFAVRGKMEGNQLIFEAKKATKTEKMVMNTFVAHVKNMVKGVTEGHVYKMKICSGHFPMNVTVSKTEVTVKNFVGEKVPRIVKVREGVNVKLEGDDITLEGIDLTKVSQTAADIENKTKRPGFDTRIFQEGIYITVKDGKELTN